MVQVQQQCSVYFCIKIFFKSWFVWLIWSFECLILMILTMTKYHENLLRDSPLSLLSIVKFFSSLETKMVLKIPNETFLRNTLYPLYVLQLRMTHSFADWVPFNSIYIFQGGDLHGTVLQEAVCTKLQLTKCRFCKLKLSVGVKELVWLKLGVQASTCL